MILIGDKLPELVPGIHRVARGRAPGSGLQALGSRAPGPRGTLGDDRRRSGTLGDARRRSAMLGDARRRSGTLGDARRRLGTLGDARGRSGTLGDARGRSATLGDAQRRTSRADCMFWAPERPPVAEESDLRWGWAICCLFFLLRWSGLFFVLCAIPPLKSTVELHPAIFAPSVLILPF